MLSHPLTFLVGYLGVALLVSFFALGPLGVFVLMLTHRRLNRRYVTGVYWGISATAFGFMILHYLLYLRGYGVTDWSALFGDIFYPPQYF